MPRIRADEPQAQAQDRGSYVRVRPASGGTPGKAKTTARPPESPPSNLEVENPAVEAVVVFVPQQLVEPRPSLHFFHEARLRTFFAKGG